MDRWTADALDAVSAFHRGDFSKLVETYDRIRDEAGVPSDVFIWWEDVVAHIELGNGARALGLVEHLESQLKGDSRYQVLPEARVLYEKGRALELLGQPDEAATAYETIVSQLGDAIEGMTRLRDAPERLSRLRASG